jgi:hypothetical protein
MLLKGTTLIKIELKSASTKNHQNTSAPEMAAKHQNMAFKVLISTLPFFFY